MKSGFLVEVATTIKLTVLEGKCAVMEACKVKGIVRLCIHFYIIYLYFVYFAVSLFPFFPGELYLS